MAYNLYPEENQSFFEHIKKSYNQKYFEDSLAYISNLKCYFDYMYDDYVVDMTLIVGKEEFGFRHKYLTYLLMSIEPDFMNKSNYEKFRIILTMSPIRSFIEKIKNSIDKIKTKNDALLHMKDPDEIVKIYAKYLLTKQQSNIIRY